MHYQRQFRHLRGRRPGQPVRRHDHLTECTVSGNSAAKGGGVTNLSAGKLSLVDTTISGNTASGHGGGLYNYGTATLINVTVAANLGRPAAVWPAQEASQC